MEKRSVELISSSKSQKSSIRNKPTAVAAAATTKYYLNWTAIYWYASILCTLYNLKHSYFTTINGKIEGETKQNKREWCFHFMFCSFFFICFWPFLCLPILVDFGEYIWFDCARWYQSLPFHVTYWPFFCEQNCDQIRSKQHYMTSTNRANRNFALWPWQKRMT